jgi:hypothetical protein
MEVLALLAQMGRAPTSEPPIRDLQIVFALHLAAVADKLTQRELQDFIQLGADIGRRTTRLTAVTSSLV